MSKPKRGTTTVVTPPVDDPVAAARAEVERLNDAELRLSMAYRLKADSLGVLKAARGDAVLDAQDADKAAHESARQVSTLEQELEALADGAHRARERRLVAIPAVFAAECDQQEQRASAMQGEADKLEAESDRLRAALEQHDDWGFCPAQGKIDGRYVSAVMRSTEYRVVDARGPRFMRLRGEAQALKSQAAQGRFRVAHDAGSLEAGSLEELVETLFSVAMRIGPSVDSIISWIEQVRDKEQRRRSRTHSTQDGFVPSDTPMRLHLTWQHGVIDQVQSWVVQPAAPEVRAYAESRDVGKTIDTILAAPVPDNSGATIDSILASPYDDADLVTADKDA